MQRSFCLYIPQVQPTLCFTRYIRQRGVFVSQFILFTVFGDTRFSMSSTSLYAFLVWYNQAPFINADFGRLVGTKTFSDDEVVLLFGWCLFTLLSLAACNSTQKEYFSFRESEDSPWG